MPSVWSLPHQLKSRREVCHPLISIEDLHTNLSAAVAANTLDQLQFFSQYSAAAYCVGNNNSPNTKITCPKGNCARVEAANTTTLTEFEK